MRLRAIIDDILLTQEIRMSGKTSNTAEPIANQDDVVSLCLSGDVKGLESLLSSNSKAYVIGGESSEVRNLLSQGLVAAAKFPVHGVGLPKMLHKQSFRMVKIFLKYGINFEGIEKQFLIACLKSENFETLDLASKSGLSIKRYANVCADTALASANKKVIEAITNYNVSINQIDDHFETSFLRLCANRIMLFTDEKWNQSSNNEHWYLEKILTLISAGVDIEAKDKIGATGLMRSIIAGNFQLAKALINSGADITAKLPNGVSTSHIAAACSPREFLRFYLSKNPCQVDLSRLQSKRIQPDSRALITQHIKSVSLSN